MSSPQRTLVIVGAGFSGALVAANLLKSQHWAATRIVLIERAAQLARGKAYADREHTFLLNVPAGRMSADPKSPSDFLTYAQHRVPTATADDFLPRALYGQYLEATLLDAELSAPPHVRLDRVRGEVVNVEKVSAAVPKGTALRPWDTNTNGSQFRVELSDGRAIAADDVVLALGNPPSASFPGTDALSPSHYTPDPWAAPPDSFRPGESVLLIGAGLTMVDVAMAATSHNDQVEIHCVSRHGLLPTSQTPFSHASCKGDTAAILRAASFSALTLLRSVRELVDETERRGGDWREAITFIRSIAPALWQRLPLRERRRTLRHIRPYWDVHRHRLPTETFNKLKQLRQRQKLKIHAGRLVSFEPVGSQVRVTWHPRGTTARHSMLVNRVVNCTGPDYNITRATDPLVRSLLSQGLITPDPLNLGIRTGPYGAAIDSTGHESNNLFYVGPLLRADHWESTAAQELRTHCERLASYLSAPLGRHRATRTA